MSCLQLPKKLQINISIKNSFKKESFGAQQAWNLADIIWNFLIQRQSSRLSVVFRKNVSQLNEKNNKKNENKTNS